MQSRQVRHRLKALAPSIPQPVLARRRIQLEPARCTPRQVQVQRKLLVAVVMHLIFTPFCISVERLDLSICVCRHLVCKSWCWRDRRRRGVHCWCWRNVLNDGRLCGVHCGCRQRRGRHKNCRRGTRRSCCDGFGRKSKHVSPRYVLTTKILVMRTHFVCRNSSQLRGNLLAETKSLSTSPPLQAESTVSLRAVARSKTCCR